MLRCSCICISLSLLFLSGCATTRSTNGNYDSSTTVSTSADGFYIPVDNSDTPSSDAVNQQTVQAELANKPIPQGW